MNQKITWNESKDLINTNIKWIQRLNEYKDLNPKIKWIKRLN